MQSSLMYPFFRLPVVRQLRMAFLRQLNVARGGAMPGTPIVRYYWHKFLEEKREYIRGRALEIESPHTLKRFASQAISSMEAIDLSQHSPDVTVVGDLASHASFPVNAFDCFVVPFTYHVIRNIELALYNSISLLKPGGNLIATFSCSEFNFPNGLNLGTGGTMWLHWNFTPLQVHNLLLDAGLTDSDYELKVFGNLFSRMAYEFNLPAEELTNRELESSDLGFPLLICVRATRPLDWNSQRPPQRPFWTPDSPNPPKPNARQGHFVR